NLGSTVTITGANFDPSRANDVVKINVTGAMTVTSLSPTSMGVTVPSQAGAGKISISTPNGTAVSTADLYIPFSNYSTSAVDNPGRVAVGGGSQTATISTSAHV